MCANPCRSFTIALLLATSAAAQTFTVTSTVDSPFSPLPGELRWAINQANNTPGPNTIAFNIPGPGVHTIVLQAALPPLSDASGVVIDGLTQPGASAGSNPPATATILIELQGWQLGAATGLRIWSDNNVVRGLCINQFSQNGIHIEGQVFNTADHNLVFCNFVGTDAGGTVDLGNGTVFGSLVAGVHISNLAPQGFARENTVDGNLISGNWSDGVWIEGPRVPGDVTLNHVTENYIGTDITGKFDLGNDHEGVALTEGAHHNDVQRNLISGNDTDGVGLQGFDNVGLGAPIYTNNNLIADNLIGVDIDILPLPNTMHGVSIGAYGPVVWGFAVQNTVRNNVIANNGGAGVSVTELVAIDFANADNNLISQNAIWANTGLGIDLDLDGVTINDPLDPDPASNQQLNMPANLAAIYNGPTTTISGTLDIGGGGQEQLATIEVFKALADGSGHGEGQWYLGSVTPGPGGAWSFTTDRLAPGDLVTATTSDAANNSSEFAVNVVVAGTPSLSSDSNFFPARLGGIVNFNLNAGTANTNRIYVLAGTMSGTTPGLPLGTVTVPLNPDSFTSLVLAVANTAPLMNFIGVTDGTGQATAQLNFLGLTSPAWTGSVMHFAYVLLPFNFASNPVAVEVMPW